jgi:hypothetical protein
MNQMNRAQRIVLVLYFLTLAYCCLWIPWCAQVHLPPDSSIYRFSGYTRAGYGWLWAGSSGYRYPLQAGPDVALIQLRILAVTAIAVAAFLLAGMRWVAPTTK